MTRKAKGKGRKTKGEQREKKCEAKKRKEKGYGWIERQKNTQKTRNR